MTPRERAERAENLLTDPVMKLVFVDIREALVGQLEAVPISDAESQRDIALMLQLLKRFKTTLSGYIQDQKIIEHRQKQDKDLEERRESLTKVNKLERRTKPQ